jgi:hypothetical protein
MMTATHRPGGGKRSLRFAHTAPSCQSQFRRSAGSSFLEKVFSAFLCVSLRSFAVTLISPQSALRDAEERREEQNLRTCHAEIAAARRDRWRIVTLLSAPRFSEHGGRGYNAPRSGVFGSGSLTKAQAKKYLRGLS